VRFWGMLPALAMISQLSPAQRNDGRLWAVAFGLSLALNAVIVLMAGFSILQLEKYQPTRVVVAAPAETLKFIAPELANPPPKPAANPADPAIPVPPTDPAFARPAGDPPNPPVACLLACAPLIRGPSR